MSNIEPDTVEKTMAYRGYRIRVVGNQSPVAEDGGKWIVTYDISDPRDTGEKLLSYRPVVADTEMVEDVNAGIEARFAEAMVLIDSGKLPSLNI